MDTTGEKLTKYVFIHEPTEVIVNVYARNQPHARTQIDAMVKDGPFVFPEGKWQCIGVAPFEEEW